MRKFRLFIIASFLCATISSLCSAQSDGWYSEGDYSPATRIRITLVNPLDMERKDCPVAIERSRFPFVNFTAREIVVVDLALPPHPEPTQEEKLQFGGHLPHGEKNGRHIHYQLDDLDRDGMWDELFFITDLKPKERKVIHVYVGFNNRGLYPHRTFAAVADYARHPAPMWESELITWKLFYPTDVDVQAKRKPMLNGYFTLTMNQSGYHFEEERGSDMMTVSTTFGAGGICLFEHPVRPDSVSRPRFSPQYRTGPLHDTRYVFDVVVSGPLRSIVRAHTLNWRTGDGDYELEQFYTAYTNKLYSTCRVEYRRFIPQNAGTAFGCGIRRIMYETGFFQKGGLVISWAENMPLIDPNTETIDRKRATLKFAGTALAVKEMYRPEYQPVASFQGNHTFRIPTTPDHTYEYLVAASWSEGPVVNTPRKFKDYMITAAEEYNHPVIAEKLELEMKKDGYKPVDYWGPAEVHKLRD